jgi:hypothetical protein
VAKAQSMKNILVVALALMAIFTVSYWAYDTLRQRTFAGNNLAFAVGSGHVLVTNPGNVPVWVEMRSAGRIPFRIKSNSLGLYQTSTRQGIDPDRQYELIFEVPPGQTTIYVTRGSGVWFYSTSPVRLQATVSPLRMEGIRLIVMTTSAVMCIALYFISNAMQHRWIQVLRDRSTTQTLPTAAPSQNHPSTTG